MTNKALIAALAVLLLGTVASASVIKVPKDHEFIQAAIDAAFEGDTIIVSRGEWDDTIRV